MRVLVTAASKHAATSDSATAIAEELSAAGIETTVASPESVGSLEGYDGVVLGSGVYAGRWLGSAKDFGPITYGGVAVGGAFDSDTAVGMISIAHSRRPCASVSAIVTRQ